MYRLTYLQRGGKAAGNSHEVYWCLWVIAKLADLTVLKEVFFRLPYFESNFLIVNYISIGFIILSVLVCLFNYGSLTGKKVIQTQKKVDVFYWVLLYSLVSFLIFSTEGSLHLLTLAVPLSVLTGILISDSKAKISHELLHFMVLALIFLTQFKLLVIWRKTYPWLFKIK